MGVLLLLEVDVVEEVLMRVSLTKNILILIKVDFHCEGGLWKMFGYKSCGKARP